MSREVSPNEDYWDKVRRAAEVAVRNGLAVKGSKTYPPMETLESAVVATFHQEYEEIPDEMLRNIMDEMKRLLNAKNNLS